MSEQKKNNVFVMVVLMVLPIVLGGMFLISKNMKKEQTSVSDQSLIIPEVDDVEGFDDDKAKIYRDEQTELMYKKNQDARNVASDKDFFAIDSDFGKDENIKGQPIDKETQDVLAQYRERETDKEPIKAEQKKAPAPTKTSGSSQTDTQFFSQSDNQVAQIVEQKPQNAIPEEKPKRRSSMGVYHADRVSTGSVTEKKIDPSKKYLKAVLEEDKVIQNGSNVIFVLSEDGEIESIKHKKGSILYGRAIQGREFFEINIYQVKSANDGNTYPADLIVYDEHYNRGIRTEGFLNEVSREEGTDAVTETVDAATQGASTVRALDMATRAITRTVSRTARSKPITIQLRKGYKVYLQPKPKEK